MVCYHPITAYRSKLGRNENGKWPLVFDRRNGYVDKPVQIPCGKCIGCRLEKSRQWAMRCVHEASLYDKNSFITLTFNDENLDVSGSLVKRDFVLFMKKLRKRFGPGIRFFHCGEYGDKLQRPHHHACLFNFDFPDKELYTIRRGVKLYTSKELERIWPYGFSTIGDVNFESAAYVARYVTKKISGPRAKDHYSRIVDACSDSSVFSMDVNSVSNVTSRYTLIPEYITMSNRPGIGRDWFEKYEGDVFPHDYCVIRDGIKCRPPRYYDNIYDLTHHETFVKIKAKRVYRALALSSQNTSSRLLVKERLQLERYKKLCRSYEGGFLHNIYYRYLSSSYKKASKWLEINDFEFDLIIEDARKELLSDNNMYNFIFLDAFTPAKCPCLWSADFFKVLFEHLDNDGMILTYSNSAAVRNAFINAGFYIGKIYAPSSDKFMGTLAVKNKTLIKHELSEYDLSLLKTKAGILYRDENLNAQNEAIIKRHNLEVEQSDLISSSKFIKNIKRKQTTCSEREI